MPLQPRRLTIVPAADGCKRMLCRRFSRHNPARKHQHAGMALERARQHLRSFHTQSYPVVLNGRDRGLGDARVLTLNNLPAQTSALTYTRVFVERGGLVGEARGASVR